ncbi:MAG: ammonia channel protein [Deltaproteobacteria bacterium RBG_13_52_11]|nr:MAG: ammonia channel protein [Deltaproteobacteria bacterium RBG_13_52_11]
MKKLLFLFLLMSLFTAGAAVAQTPASPPPKVDSGDTAWLLISAALVMLMTPALALFYGGMVRTKNVLGTIMQSFIALGVITIQWILYGYSLAFGPDIGHIIGSLKWAGLSGVGLDPNPDYAATVPHQAFMIFQMMFAVITPALIAGAFAERFKFKTYLLFLILWATFVYDPLAHWVWGVGGWIRNLGGLDFAGGLVVHISAGIAALAAALVVGKRKGYGDEPMPPHNLTMTLMGAGILWFGWFGFNGGSAVASGSLATSAFVATQIAAATAALSWMIAEWAYKGNPTVLGAASGAVAGLATITPASGFVGPLPAIVIGLVAGALCYYAVNLKTKFGYDDSLDVVGVHGVGSTWGILATGLFASKAINAAGNNGLFFGNPSLLGIQALSVVSVLIYSFVVTFIILKVLDWTMGLRVSEEHEINGLDISQHGEAGYSF